jgi:hypothetical protein
VRAPSQRRALGALFLVLAALFAGVAVAAFQAARDQPGVWVVALAAAILAAWLASMAFRAWRMRPK